MKEAPGSARISGFDWPTFVKVLRSEQFLDCTQQQLAGRLEVSVSSVSKWEAGAVRPQARHRWALRKLAQRNGYRQADWPRRSFSVE